MLPRASSASMLISLLWPCFGRDRDPTSPNEDQRQRATQRHSACREESRPRSGVLAIYLGPIVCFFGLRTRQYAGGSPTERGDSWERYLLIFEGALREVSSALEGSNAMWAHILGLIHLGVDPDDPSAEPNKTRAALRESSDPAASVCAWRAVPA